MKPINDHRCIGEGFLYDLWKSRPHINTDFRDLRPHFQNTFRLSDRELLREYKQLAYQLLSRNGNLSNDRLASSIRNTIRSRIGAEFHGTWVTGAIAAQPQTAQGAIGVAPNAEILPVRVFGLYGEITSARLIEAIGYAADRGADVINMSLGGLLPDQELTDQIFQVLDKSPNVALVASAGNESLDGVAFPAAIPGVISVGATNLNGRRTFYSSYGGRLDVVAPGGETTMALKEGILTTGGTWVDGFLAGYANSQLCLGFCCRSAGQILPSPRYVFLRTDCIWDCGFDERSQSQFESRSHHQNPQRNR
jgi:subtilisin family serine protease